MSEELLRLLFFIMLIGLLMKAKEELDYDYIIIQ